MKVYRKTYTNAVFSLITAAMLLSPFQSISQIGAMLPPDTTVCAPLGVFTINAVFPQTIPVPDAQITTTGYTPPLSIPCIPASTTGATNVNLTDDSFAGPFNIGFPFSFYGNSETQFFISSNGWIGFDTPLSNYYTTNVEAMQDDPCGAGFPENGIYGVLQDWNPGVGGTVSYQTIGTAPNRRCVISWTNVPFFTGLGSGGCPGNATFQIQIHETTNIIQIFITQKPACPGLWGGGSRSGIAAPCPENANCFSVDDNVVDQAYNNEGFQYTPVQAGSAVVGTFSSVTWTCVTGSGATQTVTSPTPSSAQVNLITAAQATKRYIVTVNYAVPCGGNIVYKDTFNIFLRQYNATFTAVTPVCLGNPSTVQFAGFPVAPPASTNMAWNWGGGTATPGTGVGPHTVNWATTGAKIIKLIMSAGGCSPDTFQTTVDVVTSPVSTFTATAAVCGSAPATVTYTGNAPANATYTWNFDGGVATPASGQGPFSVVWSTPGTKNVTLTVSVGTCVSTQTVRSVVVSPAPSSTFTVPAGGICQGLSTILTYTGTATAAAIYTWGFDGGTGNPASGLGPININWSTPGTKNVTLQVNEAGCISTVTTVPVSVHATPLSSFTATTTVCPGQNATITYTGGVPAGATYTWGWDSGTSLPGAGAGPHNVNWANPGSRTISLQVASAQGCQSTTSTQPVTVNPTPTANFSTSPAGICVGALSTLTHTGSALAGATFEWNFDGGTPTPGGTTSPQSISFPAAGVYTIDLQVTAGGCVSTLVSQDITVYPTPSATFTVTPVVCPGENAAVAYTGTGSLAATYTWNFNGGNSTGSPDPQGPYSINWSSAGTKNVTLVVQENGCSSQPYSQSLTVNQQPSSSFTAASPVCAGSPSTVTYLGTSASIATYDWNFTAATPVAASTQGPHSVTWTAPGTYFLDLTVTENNCISLPTQIQVVVNPIPTSDFSASTPVCLDGESTLSYSGTAPASAIYNWTLDGGISSGSSGALPFTVNWSAIGTKQITLNVSSLGCLSSETSQDVVVLALPLVNAGDDKESCSGALVEIGVAGTPGYTYTWSPSANLDDPYSPVSQLQVLNNSAVTQTTLYVLTTNDGQCSASDTMSYSVTAPPFVSFAAPQGQCLFGNQFQFEAEGVFTPTADFIWSFGPAANISSGNVVNPSGISFSSTGSQTITLQVNDAGCFSNLYTADVLVFAEPVADFVAEVISGCAPLSVNFTNLSASNSTNIYTWTFGEGGSSSFSEPKYLYENGGTFDVSLVVTTEDGCTASMDKKDYVTVYSVPVAGFSLSATDLEILEPQLSFSSNSLFADSIWFYISTGDTLFGPAHTIILPDTGLYVINQVVKNALGCGDTTYRQVKVHPGYRIYIPNSFSPNNDGTNDYFTVYGEEINDFHVLIFNRWGQQIYESYDMENGWDGSTRLSGEISMGGTYLYVIETTDDRGFVHKMEGIINIIR